MAGDKTKGPLEQFEVLVGHVVRRPFRRFMRGRFELLKKQDEKVWLGAAWVYKKQPDKAGDFEKLLLVGLTAGEFFADWIASKTGTLGQIVARGAQEIMEDTPAVIRDYFSELPDDVFPAGYTGPSPEDFGVIAKRINEFLKESFGVFRNWASGGFVGDFLEFDQGVIVAKATTRLGPDAMIEFTGWWDALPKHLQDEYRPALKAINETGEMGFFLLLEPKDERHRFLRSVNSMGGLRFPLNRRQRRELRVLWGRFFTVPMKGFANWLEGENKKLDPNYKNESAWRNKAFSPAALMQDPFMANLLPANDPRRVTYERQKARRCGWMNLLLTIGVMVFLALMTGTAGIIWSNIMEYGWLIMLIFGIIVILVGIPVILISHGNRRTNNG